MLLQFGSLPIAARVLGREEFGIYATVSLAVFMVAMLELGIGPALARGISEASAKGDRRREGLLYINGAMLLAGLAVVGALVAAVVLATVPIPVLFGEKYAPFVDTMRPALWLGVALMVGQITVEMTDRVREGYMEAGAVNTWGAVGNLGGAVAVFLGVQFQPSVSFLLLAVFGPNILARGISTVVLLRRRPWLISRKARPDRAVMGSLVKDGLGYSATSFGVYLVEYSLCAVIVGRVSGPADVAVFHIMMSITTAFVGLLVMVGRPMWAAVVDATESGDHEWLISVTRRYYLFLGALTGCAATTLIAFGPWLIHFVYGAEFQVGRFLFVGHALFIFALGWRRVNRYLLIGLDMIRQTVAPVLVGLVTGLAVGVAGMTQWGLGALFAGMGLCTILITGLKLQALIAKALGDLDKAPSDHSTPLQPPPLGRGATAA